MKLQTGIILGQVILIMSLFIISVSAEQADNPSITINAVQSINIGDLLDLSGNTTLPKDSHLLVSLNPDNNCSNFCTGSGINTMVFAGQNGYNFWSAAMDTSSFGYGNYQINITQILNYTPQGIIFGNASATQTIFMKGQVLIDNTTNKPNQNITDGYISLNTIDPKKTGDKFLIRGSTNLPVGTNVLWEIGPDQTQVSPQYSNEYTYLSSNSMVVKGDDTLNRVSHAIDTISFKPGMYNVTCSIDIGNLLTGEWKKGDIQGNTQFILE
ncbi:hypothetical protein [Methanospirillum lacunae]|uniref:DUF3821 domain-containing protein n=1 Tax=Methanospirillum lacunae TaxID=668570 RepID=A0A2V2NAS5_9EURY|nr:hypothetical protein [Methanospirillum lacunae]PWR74736.1 hypothetical protein DK846_00360 [Methanospirillum lacunae]